MINHNTQMATLIVLVLAEKGRLSKKTICQLTDVSPNYFDDTVKKLIDAGLVRSTMGKNGGYELLADISKLGLYDIFCLYQPGYPQHSCLICQHPCSEEEAKECYIRSIVDQANVEFEHRLHELTFERLVQEKQLYTILKHNLHYQNPSE